ncbi:BAT1-like protein, partial [Mya arenaria]
KAACISETKWKKNTAYIHLSIISASSAGSGVFISPKGVLEGTGSIGFCLIIWAACGMVSTLGALSYAELGTSIPRSGGEHAYLMYIFGSGTRRIGTLVGIFILRPVMFSVMTLSLGTYLVKPFFPTCTEPPDLPVKLFTILARQTEYISDGFQGTRKDPSLMAIAFYNGLWAYDGWNNLNFITEELKNPEKNLPRAIMLGIPLVTFAYVCANVGFFAVMSREEILLSRAVAVTLFRLCTRWTFSNHFVLYTCEKANTCALNCLHAADVNPGNNSLRPDHFDRLLRFLHMVGLRCYRFCSVGTEIHGTQALKALQGADICAYLCTTDVYLSGDFAYYTDGTAYFLLCNTIYFLRGICLLSFYILWTQDSSIRARIQISTNTF